MGLPKSWLQLDKPGGCPKRWSLEPAAMCPVAAYCQYDHDDRNGTAAGGNVGDAAHFFPLRLSKASGPDFHSPRQPGQCCPMTPLQTVLHYHETTKHHPHRYARSLGYMDWANQPDPFRRFEDAPEFPLLLVPPVEQPSYDDLYRPGAVPPRPVCLVTISEFLQYSLALSAWKVHGASRWALRINPSSGNLHPTEGYVALPEIAGFTETAGIYHYAPKDHLLERRCIVAHADWAALLAGFPAGTFLAGLSSIHWREAWKYGERAYRYCQHDVGHAVAAMALSAAVQGWTVHPLTVVADADVLALLGLDRTVDFENAESEHPDLLVAVIPGSHPAANLPSSLPSKPIDSIRGGQWMGKANRLSADPVEWEIIEAVAAAGQKVSEPVSFHEVRHAAAPAISAARTPSARQIIFQRRSALAMDGRTRITADQFYLMLDRVLPRYDQPPWNGVGQPAHVDLALFVHLVDDLPPGLYFLIRSADRLDRLRAATRPEFQWNRPAGCPKTLPLYHLLSGDVRTLASNLSCGQDIAADGAFSLGMIAEFAEPIRSLGPWLYRRLFWETGAIGQVLYLEAEAAGIRSTGIGCYFDDLMHEVLGLTRPSFQSLYHFTVGGPVEDPRLTGSPPYPDDFARLQ